MLKLEIGKRYRRRDGIVTEPLVESGNSTFPFYDPQHRTAYTATGKFFPDGEDHSSDLIDEVVDKPVTIEPGEEFTTKDAAKCAVAKGMEVSGVVFEYELGGRWFTRSGRGPFSDTNVVYRRLPEPEPASDQTDEGYEHVPLETSHTVRIQSLPDSGDRTNFSTGAVRDAASNKGLPSLIPPQSIIRLAKRFEDGATKYSRNNWMKGIPMSRFQDAIQRHLLAAAEGKTDEDHLGAVLWNAAAWIWTEDEIAAGRLPAELDDLPYRGRA